MENVSFLGDYSNWLFKIIGKIISFFLVYSMCFVKKGDGGGLIYFVV